MRIWKIVKLGYIPMSAVLLTLSVYSQAQDAKTWGLPSWVWLAIGCLLLLSVTLFIVIGLFNENKHLRENGVVSSNGNTLVIKQNNTSKEHDEHLKKSVIADIENGKIKVKIKRGKIEDLSNTDKSLVITLGHQMEFISGHGHQDDVGMLTDLACGIPINELINRNCTICGKPRNKPEEGTK